MEADGFASEGREVFPNMHYDYMQAHEFSTWPQQALEDLDQEYETYLNLPNNMPHHQERARIIRSHIVFELMYRSFQGFEVDGGTPEAR